MTVCLFTADDTDAPLFRVPVSPSEGNGLHAVFRLMVDKLATVSKERIGGRIGRLDDADVVGLNRAILVFPGVAQVGRGVRRGTLPFGGDLMPPRWYDSHRSG